MSVEIPVVVFGNTPSWITATANDSVNADKLRNSGLTKLYIRNNGTLDRVVTVIEQRPCNYGHPLVNFTVSVAAGETLRTGTFRKDRYNGADGKIAVYVDAAEALSTVEYAGVEEQKEMGR